LSADTSYSLWFEYEKGTGANFLARLAITTDAVKPAMTSYTSGAAVTNAVLLILGNVASGSAGNLHIDKLRISYKTPIGVTQDEKTSHVIHRIFAGVSLDSFSRAGRSFHFLRVRDPDGRELC
jgi:hypothetical protein